ncbi:MAG: hypothetical protein U0175_26230 [Caldilineaceae bacterium]
MTTLESNLNSFDKQVRKNALAQLLAQFSKGVPQQEVANMHCHTFYSFNAYGYSPTGLAWLAYERGWPLMGLIDFDVLDGVDEFLASCDAADVRGSCGIETRVYFPEFSTRETNSPGEPGIMYHIGLGFTSSTPAPEAAPILADMRARARQRNLGVMERVNAHLGTVQIDYDQDVLPLTPSGNATERHMIVAYLQAAERVYQGDALANFWADRLGMTKAEMEKLMKDLPGLQNTVRSKLMKKGGVGYVQPSFDSFPDLQTVNKLIVGCGALPCHGFLDGTLNGEQAMEELLTTLIANGVVVANIVPDRNWNLKDPAQKALKLQKLYDYVQMCRDLDLLLNIGTEMNSPGNKLMDDFDVPEIAPVRQDFLDGAYFIYGHTVMQRHCDMGYQSAWSQSAMSSRKERNEFYMTVGKAVPPGEAGRQKLAGVSASMRPEDVIRKILL